MAPAQGYSGDKATVLDIAKYPGAQRFVERCYEFFGEVQDLTPGHELESRLNANYGPGTNFYDDFNRMIKSGLDEGWVAETELDGPRYRRGKILVPCEESRYFSITTVYMDSMDHDTSDPNAARTFPDDHDDETHDDKAEYRGQYHAHPYGEINCVITMNEGAELKGMQSWQGDGWTSPGPGTHHYPAVRGGALVALFFLPAGRISYNAKPGMKQPVSL